MSQQALPRAEGVQHDVGYAIKLELDNNDRIMYMSGKKFVFWEYAEN